MILHQNDFNTEKRLMTDINFDSALSVNKDRVINLLRHGQFATHGLLNLEGVERAIETSSHGIGGVSFILMKLIAAELIFEGYL